MKKTACIILLFLLVANILNAGIPQGYYSSLDGERGMNLKYVLMDCIKNHRTFSYSSLWSYYPSIYYKIDNKDQVRDLYSDDVNYYSSSAVTSAMNKEHTVPKSWWGGSTGSGPGCDVINVIPSEQKANSAKSNYPIGIVSGKGTFDNGVTKVGSGTVNGVSQTYFEPCDKYKGDFARIYMYVATCYPDLAWDTNNAKAMTNTSQATLQSWIIPLILEWNAMDPVDQEEIMCNENNGVVQGNRNPFVDYPELADYIWGSKSNEDFNLSEHKPNDGTTTTVLYAGRPAFSFPGGTAEKPAQLAVGSSVTVKGGNSQSCLYVKIDDGEWQMYKYKTNYNGTSGTEYYTAPETAIVIDGNVKKVMAYCTMEERENSDTLEYYYQGVNYESEYILYEDFATVTSGTNTTTAGSSSAWNGNENFPTVSRVFQAGNAIKLGSGSSVGSMTSKPMAFVGGKVDVTLEVKGWSAVEGKLTVTVTGAETKTLTYSAIMSSDWETLNFTLENVSANPTITLATTAKRAFINKVAVKSLNSTGGDDAKIGDANGDGIVSVADLALMASYILDGQGDINKDNADTNKDGEVTVADLAQVAALILGAE